MSTRIGSGSVADVYILAPDALLAFKVASEISRDKTQQLSDEFENASKVYKARQNEAQLFRVPAPIALYARGSTKEPKRQSVVTDHVANHLDAHKVDDYFLQLHVNRSTIALERIPKLPPYLSHKISQRFPFLSLSQSLEMCSIYLTKKHSVNLTKTPSDDASFALDPAGYMEIQGSIQNLRLPSIDTIASEMGKALATIHLCGLDGAGTKFVLAGSTNRAEDIKEQISVLRGYTVTKSEAPYQPAWAFYVFSFERMTRLSDDYLNQMVMAYFKNFPYFPTPCLNNKLYKAFKDGYFAALTSKEGFKETAVAFFEKMENQQQLFPYSDEKFEEAEIVQEKGNQQSSSKWNDLALKYMKEKGMPLPSQKDQQSSQGLKANDPTEEQTSQSHESLPMEHLTTDLKSLHGRLAGGQSVEDELAQYPPAEQHQRLSEMFPLSEFLHVLKDQRDQMRGNAPLKPGENRTRFVNMLLPGQYQEPAEEIEDEPPAKRPAKRPIFHPRPEMDGYEVRMQLEQQEREEVARLAQEQESNFHQPNLPQPNFSQLNFPRPDFHPGNFHQPNFLKPYFHPPYYRQPTFRDFHEPGTVEDEVRMQIAQQQRDEAARLAREEAARLAREQAARDADMAAFQDEQLRQYYEDERKRRQHEEEMELMYPTDEHGGLYGPCGTGWDGRCVHNGYKK